MKKPMTDFIMRGGLGELLASATAMLYEMGDQPSRHVAVKRLQLAIDDGIKAREDEAKAGAKPMTPRAVCGACMQLYFVCDTGPQSVGYCSYACYPAENVPRGVV